MKKQSGFTLIEIMIALVIGLIVVGATISIYITSVKGSSDVVKSARLNYDLDSALALMVNDIRRSGYWGGAIVGSDNRDNPFTQATTNLQRVSASCVLYTYDSNNSGANTLTDLTDDVDADEFFGFKLNGTNVQMRMTGTTTGNCDNGTWETINISDGSGQIGITDLTFTESSKCLRKRNGVADVSYNSTCATASGNFLTGDRIVETRQIDVTLAGRVNNDQAVTKSVSDTIKIRNDRIFSAP